MHEFGRTRPTVEGAGMLVEVNENGYSPACLKVIGMGGAGGNAVNRMLESEIRGVEFLVANTDIQALNVSACTNRIQLGAAITGGLGSGGDPSIGRKAAEEDRDAIREHLEGADMIFITAGMGGGTGTGASPVVAQIARELGALTVGIVTRPFTFEGRRRMRQAEEGLEELRECVDTLIVIPNQRLLHVVDRNTPLNEALRVADDVLAHAAKGISEIITVPGLINVDFADVRSVMRDMGNALMGMGFGQGADRSKEAAQMAISSPLLEDVSISGAQALLVNFLGGEDLTLAEVEEASNEILQAAGEEANVIFGAVIDPRVKDEIRVTLIATGFGNHREQRSAAGTTAVEAERLLADEFRGQGRPEHEKRTPLTAAPHLRVEREPREAEAFEEEDEEELMPVDEAPLLVGPRNASARRPIGPVTPRPLPVREAQHGVHARTQSGPSRPVESSLFDDGVVGAARPMRRGVTAQARQAEARDATEPQGAMRRPADGRPAEARPTVVSRPPEPTTRAAAPTSGATTAPSGPEIPENVVPLVWKQNLRGREWSPTMSSRWQRVLRRDRLDVPSFLRRRQVD